MERKTSFSIEILINGEWKEVDRTEFYHDALMLASSYVGPLDENNIRVINHEESHQMSL